MNILDKVKSKIGGRSASVFQEIVENATSEVLQTPDWDRNNTLVDLLRSEPKGIQDALQSIQKRLHAPTNPRVQFLALTLLDMCVKNCGPVLRTELCKHQSLLDDLYKLCSISVRKCGEQEVQYKALEMVYTWHDNFKDYQPYRSLCAPYVKARGTINFAGVEVTDQNLLAEEVTRSASGLIPHSPLGTVSSQPHALHTAPSPGRPSQQLPHLYGRGPDQEGPRMEFSYHPSYPPAYPVNGRGRNSADIPEMGRGRAPGRGGLRKSARYGQGSRRVRFAGMQGMGEEPSGRVAVNLDEEGKTSLELLNGLLLQGAFDEDLSEQLIAAAESVDEQIVDFLKQDPPEDKLISLLTLHDELSTAISKAKEIESAALRARHDDTMQQILLQSQQEESFFNTLDHRNDDEVDAFLMERESANTTLQTMNHPIEHQTDLDILLMQPTKEVGVTSGFPATPAPASVGSIGVFSADTPLEAKGAIDCSSTATTPLSEFWAVSAGETAAPSRDVEKASLYQGSPSVIFNGTTTPGSRASTATLQKAAHPSDTSERASDPRFTHEPSFETPMKPNISSPKTANPMHLVATPQSAPSPVHPELSHKTVDQTHPLQTADPALSPQTVNSVSSAKTVDPAPSHKTVDQAQLSQAADQAPSLQTVDPVPSPKTADQAPLSQAADQAPSPQTVDSVPSPQTADQAPSPQTADQAPSPQTVDPVPSPQAADQAPSPQTVDPAPPHKTVDQAQLSQAADQAPSPQTVDPVPSPQTADQAPSPQTVDPVPSPQTADQAPFPKTADQAPSHKTVDPELSPGTVDPTPSPRTVNQAPSHKTVDPAPSPKTVPQTHSLQTVDQAPSPNAATSALSPKPKESTHDSKGPAFASTSIDEFDDLLGPSTIALQPKVSVPPKKHAAPAPTSSVRVSSGDDELDDFLNG